MTNLRFHSLTFNKGKQHIPKLEPRQSQMATKMHPKVDVRKTKPKVCKQYAKKRGPGGVAMLSRGTLLEQFSL